MGRLGRPGITKADPLLFVNIDCKCAGNHASFSRVVFEPAAGSESRVPVACDTGAPIDSQPAPPSLCFVTASQPWIAEVVFNPASHFAYTHKYAQRPTFLSIPSFQMHALLRTQWLGRSRSVLDVASSYDLLLTPPSRRRLLRLGVLSSNIDSQVSYVTGFVLLRESF